MSLARSVSRPLWASQRFPGGSGLWRGGLWTSQRALSATAQIRTLLFGGGEQGALYYPRPIVDGNQVLWQDAAGTTPVTADGQVVGRVDDLSGKGNHATQSTAAAKPIYRTDGTLHWLELDGVDDFSESPTVSSATGKGQLFAGVNVEGSGAVETIIVRGDPFNTPYGMGLYAPRDATNELGTALQLSGSNFNNIAVDNAAYAAPYRAVLTALGDSAGSTLTLRTNGTQIGTNTIAANDINFADSKIVLGRRSASQSSLYFTGRIYLTIARFGPNLVASEIADAESYIADKTGVTL